MTPNDSTCLIYQVIRGERPCSDLAALGVKIERIDDTWHFKYPPLPPVRLQISDIGYGLLRYRTQPEELKKWARFILCCDFADFEECEKETGWELLLNALWDAMGSGAFSDSAFHFAEEIAK